VKKKTAHQKHGSSKRKTPVSVRFRLMWIIPSVFALFTIASGYFALSLSKYFFLPPRNPAYGDSVGTLWILLGILLLTALAAFAGAMIAHSITKPLKKLSKKAEMLTLGKVIKAPDEMSLLNKTLEEVFSVLDHYMKDDKILEVLHEGKIALDRDGTITHLNKVAERVLGMEAAQVEGTHFMTTFGKSQSHKKFRNLVENTLNRNETQTFKDIEVAKEEGGTVRLNGSITPGADDTGEPEGAVITFQDPFEVEQMRAWIKQADQMAGLGTMAAGIAHEIRNPLASIRGLMELIREDMTETDLKRKYADTIISEVDRANKIVEEVLDFAQTDHIASEPVDINDSLKQVLYVGNHLAQEKNVSIRQDLGKDLPLVLARPEKLTQAFENLLINAISATPVGGSVRVTSMMNGAGLSSASATHPKRIVVRFFNTGSFIPPADTERIFLPFFSTKVNGTGLGLPISHRIISSHGGKIKVNSDKDSGTTFEIELPACTQGATKE
jgi:PAS domain S-box-containing protein